MAVSLSLSTTGMQVGAIGLAVLAVAGHWQGWNVIRRTPLDGALLVFFGALALSTIASGHPLEATGWARPWVVIAYFAVYWWLRDRAQAAWFVRLTVAAAAFTAVYGIVQHFTGLDWYRGLLGRATEVRLRDAESSGYAIVGFFRNYLTFAHTMLFPLAWAGALALRGSWLGLGAAPLLVVALVFSTARGAWLAALAVAGTLAGLGRGRRAAAALASVVLAGAIGFAGAPDLRALATGMFATDGPNRGRIGIYRANLEIIHEHPVLGLGFGRYRNAARPYYDRHPEADRRSHAHSNYLQIGAEAGLVGLAALGFLFAVVLRRGWPALGAAPDAGAWAAAAGAWAGVIGFLVGGITQYTLGDNEVALSMWVALAVLMRCRER